MSSRIPRVVNSITRGFQSTAYHSVDSFRVGRVVGDVATGVLQKLWQAQITPVSSKPQWTIPTAPKIEDDAMGGDPYEFGEDDIDADGDGDMPQLEEDPQPTIALKLPEYPQFKRYDLAGIVLRNRPFLFPLATSGYAFKDIEEVVTTRVFAETIEETRSVTLVAPKIIEETPTVTQAPAKKSYWDMIMGVLIAVRDAFASSITSLTKLFK